MKIHWTIPAQKDLRIIESYIKQENPTAAINVISQIIKKVKTLIDNPSIGKPGRFLGTRELIIHNLPYIIPYRVKNEIIEVLRVIHTSRKYPEKL